MSGPQTVLLVQWFPEHMFSTLQRSNQMYALKLYNYSKFERHCTILSLRAPQTLKGWETLHYIFYYLKLSKTSNSFVMENIKSVSLFASWTSFENVRKVILN